MVYESNYRPACQVYDDELMHYGVKGMRWGRRKAKIAASIYGMNARAYSKSNKTLSSMNRAAQKKQLAKVADYDKQIAARKTSKKKATTDKKAVKKTMSQMAGKTLKTSAKVAGYGAQVVARMMQNNVTIGTTGAMFDSIYD